MNRRTFLAALTATSVTGCGLARIDPWHVLIRSDHIRSLVDEQQVLKPTRLSSTSDGRMRVIYLKGSAYDRGYQQGRLLQSEIQDNLGYLYKKALKTFYFEEIFAEVYERMRPFIPQEYIDEMQGLAHGARLPLHLIHHIHILPEIGEWGGKKRIKKIIKEMMAGEPEAEWGTSCSNFCADTSVTKDGKFYTVRVLDWGLHRISKLHQYPLIAVNVPDDGIPSANVGWMGFLGAISGMNAEGITLGEMGYKDPPDETLYGKPMPFLLRDVLSYCKSLKDVRKVLGESKGTNSFIYLMSDGKSKKMEMYIKDAKRFEVYKPGDELKDGERVLPPIEGMMYGGHDSQLMSELLAKNKGVLDLEFITKQVIPQIAMNSNFQNVVYEASDLHLWVSMAKDKKTRGAEAEYSFFDLRQFLAQNS